MASLFARVLALSIVTTALSASRLSHAEDGSEADASRVDPAAATVGAVGAIGAIPSAPPDTVYLRSGGMVRGRVQEILPSAHVTVSLVTGEVRRIPWSEIDRVIVASAATVPPLAADPASYAQPPTSTPAGASASPTTAPAAMLVASSELRLREGAGHTANLVIDPTSPGGMVIGVLIGGGGAMGAYVGLLMALVGQAQSDADSAPTSTGTTERPPTTVVRRSEAPDHASATPG